MAAAMKQGRESARKCRWKERRDGKGVCRDGIAWMEKRREIKRKKGGGEGKKKER
jgi:hypothetical protein